MTDLTSLAGRTALVTGASRGIGYAIAAELLTRGASVTVTARKPDELDAAAAKLAADAAGGDTGRVLAVAANAGSAESREASVTQTVERFGSLDILINNTGINPTYGFLMDADLAAVSKTFDTNVVATLAYVQLAYRAWMAEHGGTIVNIASVAGLQGAVNGPHYAGYAASKAGLMGLTRELAASWGRHGIRVNAIAPGFFHSRLADPVIPLAEPAIRASNPIPRIGSPGELKGVAVFLASDASNYITGQTIVVDGGGTIA